MATPYNHKAIEQKWRKHWQEHPVNVNDGKKPKYYCLDMFPYPSGSGLHVGHWRGYVISDVWSRYKLLNGYYVIHPMGWDAFGLPAENYAIKMGTHPRISTEANIKNIKRQINEISAIYDWDMEVNTTDPEFYKWTQWIFVKMFKKGLAYVTISRRVTIGHGAIIHARVIGPETSIGMGAVLSLCSEIGAGSIVRKNNKG